MRRLVAMMSTCGVLSLGAPVASGPKAPESLAGIKKLQFRVGKFKGVRRVPGGELIQHSEGTWQDNGGSLVEHVWTTSNRRTWETTTVTSYDPHTRQFRQRQLQPSGRLAKEMIGRMDGQNFVLEAPAPDGVNGTTGLYTLAMKDQRLRVAKAQPGSSAARAGIRAGDIITTIDNRPAANGRQLLGRDGSTVRLTVLRVGKARHYALKRERFVTKMTWEPRRGGGYRTSWSTIVNGHVSSNPMMDWQPDR